MTAATPASSGGIIWTNKGLIWYPGGIRWYSAADAAAIINRGWSGSEDAAEVWVRARRQGIGGLTPRQLLILAFICLLTHSAPVVAQEYLPHEGLSLFDNEFTAFLTNIQVVLAVILSNKR